MIAIILCILGVFSSWYFTRLYYLKAEKDSGTIISLIKKRAITLIKEEIKDRSNADKFIKKSWDFLIRTHGEDFISKRCPYCGSDHMENINAYADEYSDGIDITICGECGKEL